MWGFRKKLVTIVVLGLASLCYAGSDDAKIVFINSTTSQQMYDFSQSNQIVKNPKFDSNRKTVLYIHGYIESLTSSTTQMIINAYIKQANYNILVLDWSTLAGGSYPNAVENLRELGPKVAEALINSFGQELGNIHIVGHSLGSHLAGLIGRTINTKSNGAIKLQRISGLDPAFPLYYPPIFGNQHISRNDATFVDIIHTDAGGYGTPKVTGTVDFWVNSGRRFQPGCPVGVFMFLSDTDLCSHHRSVQIWAESVALRSSTAFIARKIKNPSMKATMGNYCSINTAPGSYSIQTNSMSPYSKS